jgi:hypothetical protein
MARFGRITGAINLLVLKQNRVQYTLMPKVFVVASAVLLSLIFISSVFLVRPQSAFAVGESCEEDADCDSGLVCRATTTGSSEKTCSTGSGNTKSTKAKSSVKEINEFQTGLEAADLNAEKTHNKALDDFASSIVTGVSGGKPTKLANGEVEYSVGLVGSMGNYMAMMYANPAATSHAYIADLMNSAGVKLAQPAYAQGLGFASLNPILETWKKFRNIAYFFFVIVFLVIGFMIMFRQKISGQTVVTAQQAIPHVIVSLLAVTFSYAIAGFLIDIMYLVMYLMLGLFRPADTFLITDNIFSIGLKVLTTGGGAAYEAIDMLVQSVSANLNPTVESVLSFVGGLTFAVVFALALAFGIFRLFFELLKTYVSIVISITFSPIVLMMGAVPGQNTFGKWVKSLVGNLATFPLVLLILIIFYELTENVSDGSSGFLAPYLIGQGSGQAIASMVGLGALLIATDLVKQGQKAMGATGGIFEQFGQNFGDALKKGWSGGQLVPGLGFTDTSKWPGGGLSAKNVLRKGAITTSAIGQGALGGTLGLGSGLIGLGGSPITGTVRGFRRGGQQVSDLLQDPNWFSALRKERQDKKSPIGYGDGGKPKS